MRILCGLSASLTESMFMIAEFKLLVLSLLSSKNISFVFVEFVLLSELLETTRLDFWKL